MNQMQELIRIIEQGQSKQICACLARLLEQGYSADQIIQEGVMPAMEHVGQLFENQSVHIPAMLMSARTVHAGSEYLHSQQQFPTRICRGKVVIGTVQGDLHSIGKNLVAMFMRTMGIDVIDLGVDVSAEQFLSAVQNDPEVAIVCLSSLLTTTMPAMRKTVRALLSSPASERITIMVGGGPVTQSFAESIGAHIYTKTANDAAMKAYALLSAQDRTP